MRLVAIILLFVSCSSSRVVIKPIPVPIPLPDIDTVFVPIREKALTVESFGAVGNGIGQDVPAFLRANDYARANPGYTITGNRNYNLEWDSKTKDSALIVIDYSNVTWDLTGATLTYSNGVNHLFAIGTDPAKVWADRTLPKRENITIKGFKIRTTETNEYCSLPENWNVNAHGIHVYDNVRNLTIENITFTNIPSEAFYGCGYVSTKEVYINKCTFKNCMQGVSTSGELFVTNTKFEDIAVNAIENTPFGERQNFIDVDIKNCGNGITLGASSSDINLFGTAFLDRVRISGCKDMGVMLTRRVRGVSISNCFIWDNRIGTAIYTQNDLYDDALSDIRIYNTTYSSEKYDVSIAILLLAADKADSLPTSNITIDHNTFSTLATSRGSKIITGIAMYGSNFKNVVITDNTDAHSLKFFDNKGRFKPVIDNPAIDAAPYFDTNPTHPVLIIK